MDKGIKVNYETLFELLMREKSREELQKLEPGFFADFVNYLKDKQDLISRESIDVFSEDEKEKAEKQIRSIKGVLKKLYERREKKILNLALIKSRTASSVIDASALLEEEKQFFESLVNILDQYRLGLLFNLISGKLPEMAGRAEEAAAPKAEDKKEEKSVKTVRFMSAVPKFLGKELEVYGPFEEEDVANLPGEVADVLIKKGRAEEINT